jgi:outer membrane protein W
MTVLMVAAAAMADDIAETVEPAKPEAPKVRKWNLRFGVLLADTEGDAAVSADPGSVNLNLNAGGGGGVNLERQVSPLVGVEFGISTIGSNIGLSTGAGTKHAFTSTDILIMTPLTLGVNFHVANGGPVDVYAGPLLAYNRYSELSVRTGVDFPWWPWGDDDSATTAVRWTDSSELTWGARAGLGVFFGKKRKWSAEFSLTYLDATYEAERESDSARTSISLDPLMFGFGFGFRF